MSAACAVVLAASLAAHQHHVPTDVLVAIAYHESRLRPTARGDDGKSWGPWQINTAVHRLQCRSLRCQSDYAARMLRRNMGRTRTLGGAVQLWNSRNRGYALRVLAKRAKVWQIIRRCSFRMEESR